MTVFSNAAQWLEDKRSAHAKIEITYERGALSQTMNAQLGKTQYEELDAGGTAYVRFESRDYLVSVSDFNTVPGPPQVGDKITEVFDGDTYVCIVTTLGSHYTGRDAPQHYERDMHRQRYRIHTKGTVDN